MLRPGRVIAVGTELVRNLALLCMARAIASLIPLPLSGIFTQNCVETHRVLYFGDLDANGLNIPQRATRTALDAGLPPVEPHLDSYRWLLELNDSTTVDGELETMPERAICQWLEDLAEPAWSIISAGRRIAQERIGWQFLQAKTASSQR